MREADRMSTNPYALTISVGILRDVTAERLNAVSRVFVWIGLLGTLIYIPIFIACFVSLIANQSE